MRLFPVELSRFLNVFLLQLSLQGWGAFHFSLLLEQMFAKSGVGLKFGTKGNQVAAKSPRTTWPDGSVAVVVLICRPLQRGQPLRLGLRAVNRGGRSHRGKCSVQKRRQEVNDSRRQMSLLTRPAAWLAAQVLQHGGAEVRWTRQRPSTSGVVFEALELTAEEGCFLES